MLDKRSPRRTRTPCAIAALWRAAVVVLVVLSVLLAPCVSATTVRYRGSVYRGVTEDIVRRGGATFIVQVSVPAFLTDETRLRWILSQVLSTNVRLIDEDGVIVNSTANYWSAPADDERGDGAGGLLAEWLRVTEAVGARSAVEVSDGGRELRVTLAGVDWEVPPRFGVLVVPCLPFELFGEGGQVGVLDMPNNCLAGDPFLVRRLPFVHLDAARWRERRGELLVTGNPIEVPLSDGAQDAQDKFLIERDLRVVEGVTCLHTRNAFVRGSVWDIHRRVYRYTPNRGGVQTLCYTPYPETLPLLRVKLTDSYEVAGPEGVSTDPPQVRAEVEFVGTIFGTNLTERDTAVMTDELCTDFTSQNVFFVELFFSSPTRVSFFGTFHKRGIYNVCYHRAGSAAYVRVSTLLVEKGTDIVIDSDNTNVLIDQDVKLLESATVARLKVQDKGNLDLKQRSLNVSYFVWSGGTISGKGTINCTGFGKITTQGYETRQLSVPLHNYGEMTIDVQRLLLDRDGAIHNYGNLTLAVSSMGVDGISSVLSMGQHNTINNHAGGVLRIIALDERSYALLTSRIVLWAGDASVSGRVNVTDLSHGVLSSVVLKRGAELTAYNARLAGHVRVESRAVLSLMEGCALMSTAVEGAGAVRVLGEGVLLDSVNMSGSVQVQVGAVPALAAAHGDGDAAGSLTVSVYGAVVFGAQTHVDVGHVSFATTTGMAKLLFYGDFVARLDAAQFGENMLVQASGTTVVYGVTHDSDSLWRAHSPRDMQPPADDAVAATAAAAAAVTTASHRSMMSLLVPPNATFFVIDTAGIGHGSGALASHCAAYWTMSDYVALSGRVLLRGCFGIAHGASVGGTVETLARAEDWEAAVSVACRGAFGSDVAVPFCHRGTVPPERTHSGLAVGGEVYLRSPAALRVDEFVVASGTSRSADALSLRASSRAIVRRGATLTLSAGGHLEAGEIVIEGSLEVADPATTHFTGNVSVSRTGVIFMNGFSDECGRPPRVRDGKVTFDPDTKPFRCSAKSSSLSSDRLSSDSVEKPASMSSYEWELRHRTIQGFPFDLPCPVAVMEEVDYLRRTTLGKFGRSPYSKNPNTSYGRLCASAVVVFLWSTAIFLGLLHRWGSDVLEFLTDLARQPKIKVSFTWDDLSRNHLNIVLLGVNLHSRLQGTLAVFHGNLPYSLPLGANLSTHSRKMLNSYRSYDRFHFFFATSVVLGAVTCTLLSRHPRVSRNVQLRARTAQAILNMIVVFIKLPMLSWMLEGFLCNTFFQDVDTCASSRGWGTLLFSIVSFTAVAYIVPWNLACLSVGYNQLHVREKVSWVLLISFLDPLELFTWRVAADRGMILVMNSLLIQLIRTALFMRYRPIAFDNVHRFVVNLMMCPMSVYAFLIAEVVFTKVGLRKDCTSGDYALRCLLVLNTVNVLRAFYKHLYCAEYVQHTGDISVDAIQRSIEQLRARVSEMKENLYVTADPVDRENILNSLARLRIELVEKQEHYRCEVDRLLRPFYLGARYADIDGPRTARYALPSSSTRSNEASPDAIEAALRESGSPTSFRNGLLSEDEMESFSCGPALGKGSYGTVHLGILANGKLVAVKYVSVRSDNHEVLSSVMAEVNMLRELSHPNVIRYYGAHKIQDMMLVFMEFAVGGSLTSIVRKFTGLTESVMQLYTYQILRGLQYLHSKGVVHRDIKGENILIDGYGVAKLSDFGCSKSLANIANGTEAGGGTLVGSPFWMAPEVIRSEAYGTKADIWSVGCTVVEMLNGGDPPWRDEFDNVYSAMFYVGSTNDIPQIPEETSEECLDFLHRCFERDVSKRATANELLEHEWVQSARLVSGQRFGFSPVSGLEESVPRGGQSSVTSSELSMTSPRLLRSVSLPKLESPDSPNADADTK